MRESWGSTKPKGAMKVKAAVGVAQVGSPSLGPRVGEGAHHRPVSIAPSMRRSKSAHVGTRKMVNYA